MNLIQRFNIRSLQRLQTNDLLSNHILYQNVCHHKQAKTFSSCFFFAYSNFGQTKIQFISNQIDTDRLWKVYDFHVGIHYDQAIEK